MPANELNFRKKQYVQELNGFIGLKKAYSGAAGQRAELLDGAKTEAEKLSGAGRQRRCRLMRAGRDGNGWLLLPMCSVRAGAMRQRLSAICMVDIAHSCLSCARRCCGPPRLSCCCILCSFCPLLSTHFAAAVVRHCTPLPPSTSAAHFATRLAACHAHRAGMSTTELMQLGRQQVKETDAALLRSEKIVNDTMAIGIQTAETLQAQTRQLEKVPRGQALQCWRRWRRWRHAATLGLAEWCCCRALWPVHVLRPAAHRARC